MKRLSSHRRAPVVAALLVVAALGAACSSGAPRATPAVTVSPGNEPNAYPPMLNSTPLYGKGRPAVEVWPGSSALIAKLPAEKGLHVTVMKSTPGTVALYLLEDDPKVPWGTHLNAVEPAVFRDFAASPSLGSALILMTDVDTHTLQDPINPTAYRWTRPEVEQYVTCGIPASGSNDCKTEFFRQADVAIVLHDTLVHPNQ